MGIYTGTAGKDRMLDGSITPGVIPVPLNSPGPSEAKDIIWGRESDDDLSGSGGDDELHGEDGNDTLNGEGSFAKPPVGNDKLYGDGGNDHLYGNDGNDELHGGADDDYLYGQEGNDNLYGEAGKDNLDGGSGRNVLNGGLGQDLLQGDNAGTDFFDFESLADSTADKSRDVIKDFQFQVDKIDFSDIGSFKFMGTTILSPTGPNQIILFNGDNAQTIIQLHTNTDGTPESEIAVDDREIDASVYKESDFVLSSSNAGKPPGENVLQNGSFEDGPDPGAYLPLNPGSKDITGWEVTRGQIDYVGTDWVSSNGNRSVDLNGTPGIGGVAQTFTTTPGHKYHVSFDMAGHYSGLLQTMRVSAAEQSADFSFQSGTDPQHLGWKGNTWDFTAKDPQTTLEFSSLQTGYTYGGPALDDVMVTEADLLLA